MDQKNLKVITKGWNSFKKRKKCPEAKFFIFQKRKQKFSKVYKSRSKNKTISFRISLKMIRRTKMDNVKCC